MTLLATAVIYAFGLVWLSRFTGWDNVLTLGMIPFLPDDVADGLEVVGQIGTIEVRLFEKV